MSLTQRDALMPQGAAQRGRQSAIVVGGHSDNHARSVAEQVHARLYQKALDALGNNTATDYWVCDVCGNTVEGEPPDTCPICGAKRPAFKKVD